MTTKDDDTQTMHRAAERCDGCGRTVTLWTIAKGFDLLCDSCLTGRMGDEHRANVAARALEGANT